MAQPQSNRVWILRLLTALAGLGLVIGVEGLLRFVPGLGPAPLVVARAEQGGKVLHAVNRFYSQRFFFGQQGRLAAAGQMAERSFIKPAPANLYRVVFVGASTVQGFPHPRRLAAASFLEAMLQDALPERTVEVFNLGITSIASFAVAQVVADALVLEPDLVVVYTGHNEFYGIYGVGDYETPRYNRLDYALRQLHLAQLVQGAADYFDGNGSSTDLLKLMAQRGEVPVDSARRRAAEVHLRENVRQIAKTCQSVGVPLILCTLAANDAGFAPVGSSAVALGGAPGRQWSERMEGAAVRLTGDYVAVEVAEKALVLLDQAAALSAGHAWLWYLRGRALERLDRQDEAHVAFRKARDLDTMPWRAPTAHSEIIRSQARESGAILADVEAAFAAAAPPQGVGWQWAVDHVHFSVPGQALLARVILGSLGELASNTRPQLDLTLLRKDDEYRRQLGDVPAERVILHRKMADMLREKPMDLYNAHNARYLQQLTAMEWQRLVPAEQSGIKAWSQQDKQISLALTVADQLFEQRDFGRAQQYYHAARLETPFTRRGDLWATVQWAWSIKMQGRPFTDVQREAMQSTLERADFLAQDPAIEPPFIDFTKGHLHHLLGEHGPALVHLERAFLDSDFRRKYAMSLFHALAAEFLRAGRLQDAQRYAHMAGEGNGRGEYFLQLVEAPK